MFDCKGALAAKCISSRQSETSAFNYCSLPSLFESMVVKRVLFIFATLLSCKYEAPLAANFLALWVWKLFVMTNIRNDKNQLQTVWNECIQLLLFAFSLWMHAGWKGSDYLARNIHVQIHWNVSRICLSVCSGVWHFGFHACPLVWKHTLKFLIWDYAVVLPSRLLWRITVARDCWMYRKMPIMRSLGYMCIRGAIQGKPVRILENTMWRQQRQGTTEEW